MEMIVNNSTNWLIRNSDDVKDILRLNLLTITMNYHKMWIEHNELLMNQINKYARSDREPCVPLILWR